jgi:Ig-like domain CHU_C associated/Regulator of chromosome condensation (RCC1) repeat
MIQASNFSSYGLKANGTIWTWGSNFFGQLGDGTTTDRNIPAQVGAGNRWRSISAQDYHCFGIAADGTLWSWGTGTYGVLGVGNTTEYHSPVQVGTDNQWMQIENCMLHTGALKSDGTLWTWGFNQEGQLGDGTNIDRLSPVQIGTDQNWVTVTAFRRHTMGMKAERDKYCGTGDNAYGQLGDGGLMNRNTFNCIEIGCIPPPSPIAADTITLCAGESATLSAMGLGAIGWYSASSGGAFLGADSTFVTGPLSTSTTYYVQDSTCAASTVRTVIVVTVSPAPDTTIDFNPPMLTANQNFASYQWLDCNNGLASIPGDTLQYFWATITGDYAVEITLGSCIDTSACVKVLVAGRTREQATPHISIFPNPSVGQPALRLRAWLPCAGAVALAVYDMQGRQLDGTMVMGLAGQNEWEIPVSRLAAGAYLLRLQSVDGVASWRFVVE